MTAHTSLKSAAVLTIHSPGKMSAKGRRGIVQWLQRQITHFRQYGSDYTTGRYTARYLYEDKVKA